MFRDYVNVFLSIVITIAIMIVINVNSVACQRIPDNPCSDVFRYSRSQNGIYYGDVEIPNDGSKTLDFRVNVSLIGLYQNQNNLKLKLELLSSENDILTKPTIQFRINFPLQNVLPKITQIMHNGRIYCSGPPEELSPAGITNLWSQLSVQISNYVYPIQGGAPIQTLVPQQPSGQQPQITNVIVEVEEIDLSQNPFLQNPQPSRPVQTERPQVQWTQTQTQRPQTQRPQTQRPQTQRPQTQVPPTQRPHQTQRPQTQRPQTQRPPHSQTPPTELPLHTSKPFQPIQPSQSVDNQPLYVSERLPDNSCGLANDIQSLIINGESTARNEFPWLVAMFQKTGITFRFHCSANLISETAVVTAAHCVQFHKAPLIQTKDILLVMGESNLDNWVTSKAATVSKASQVVVHPDYRQFTGHCDVAVVILAERIAFKWSVRPICLLTGAADASMSVGMQGVVAGWGKDESGKQTVAVPKKVTMKVASQETCLRSNVALTKLTSEFTFCAGNRDGSGPCTGDSGGGFMVTQNGKWFLRGLVSTAVKSDDDFACNLYEYIVFSDAAKLGTWIKSVMK